MSQLSPKPTWKVQNLAALGAVALFLAGCNTDMWRQPRHEPLDASEFFADGQANRPLVPGTIARDHLRVDNAFYTGAENGKWVYELPVPLTKALLKRGQERFEIYCTPCHGQLGDGNGMIAARGLKLRRPVGNYHTERLRNMPVGHFYDVITNGYGAMYSYASRIEPQDRWAIVAYIRALQLSQNASPDDADPAALTQGDSGTPESGHSAGAAGHEGGH
jgi:mono/diheme cytochrome c family protein